jgi:hypothetical protein
MLDIVIFMSINFAVLVLLFYINSKPTKNKKLD